MDDFLTPLLGESRVEDNFRALCTHVLETKEDRDAASLLLEVADEAAHHFLVIWILFAELNITRPPLHEVLAIEVALSEWIAGIAILLQQDHFVVFLQHKVPVRVQHDLLRVWLVQAEGNAGWEAERQLLECLAGHAIILRIEEVELVAIEADELSEDLAEAVVTRALRHHDAQSLATEKIKVLVQLVHGGHVPRHGALGGHVAIPGKLVVGQREENAKGLGIRLLPAHSGIRGDDNSGGGGSADPRQVFRAVHLACAQHQTNVLPPRGAGDVLIRKVSLNLLLLAVTQDNDGAFVSTPLHNLLQQVPNDAGVAQHECVTSLNHGVSTCLGFLNPCSQVVGNSTEQQGEQEKSTNSGQGSDDFLG
mmetsp:Transcript_10841/g.24842  ORF Transcript_10841/g.24842 Transcript_10841/m.24842 type:complete len:365 (+) Transcript_10841:734-1828(+)